MIDMIIIVMAEIKAEDTPDQDLIHMVEEDILEVDLKKEEDILITEDIITTETIEYLFTIYKITNYLNLKRKKNIEINYKFLKRAVKILERDTIEREAVVIDKEEVIIDRENILQIEKERGLMIERADLAVNNSNNTDVVVVMKKVQVLNNNLIAIEIDCDDL